MRAYGLPTEALEGPKRKLLIVDDHTGLGDLLTQLLEKDGRFEIRNLTSGEPPSRELADYQPELVVDIKPEISGMRVRQGNPRG
jgi:PleD family two-component response regulator